MVERPEPEPEPEFPIGKRPVPWSSEIGALHGSNGFHATYAHVPGVPVPQSQSIHAVFELRRCAIDLRLRSFSHSVHIAVHCIAGPGPRCLRAALRRWALEVGSMPNWTEAPSCAADVRLSSTAWGPRTAAERYRQYCGLIPSETTRRFWKKRCALGSQGTSSCQSRGNWTSVQKINKNKNKIE